MSKKGAFRTALVKLIPGISSRYSIVGLMDMSTMRGWGLTRVKNWPSEVMPVNASFVKRRESSEAGIVGSFELRYSEAAMKSARAMRSSTALRSGSVEARKEDGCFSSLLLAAAGAANG